MMMMTLIKTMAKTATMLILILSGLSMVPIIANAQDDGDADALARKLSNPAEANWAINSNLDLIFHGGDINGAGDQSSVGFLLQPGMPKALSKGNILFRPAIPVFLSQTFPGADGFDTKSGLGDISFDLAYGYTNPTTGLLYFVGMVGTTPTNTIDSMPNLWSFGPEAALGLVKKWGVFGALVSQQWDIESGPETRNVLGGQYFYAFSLGNGWQLAAGPTFSYNWDTEQLILPIGTGVAKTIFLGALPLKLSTQAWYYVERPDGFGNDFQIRFSVAPVIKALW